MDQSALGNAISWVLIMALTPYIIAFIIFIIWLCFGIGTLTRLTDIKYLLNDIKLAIESNNTINEDDKTSYEETISALDTSESDDTIEDSPSLAEKTVVIIQSLRKPSRLFKWILGTAFAIFIALMAYVLILNR